jgi:hypothetical protein
MQVTYPWGYFLGPAPGAAAQVEPDGVRGKHLPGEDGEVAVEELGPFVRVEVTLVETCPLIPKSGDYVPVQVS